MVQLNKKLHINKKWASNAHFFLYLKGREMDKIRVEELLTPILLSGGFELVDVEYKQEGGTFFLRVFIDKEGGLSLDDCALVNEELGTILDVEDVIPNEYTLEVSSPGVERPLKKIEDYKRFAGQRARLKLYKPLEGKKDIVGVIDSVEDSRIRLIEDKTNTSIEVDLKDIAKSNLKVW